MQEVFKDGSLGSVKPFDTEILNKLLENQNIHHVNIFKLESEYEKKANIDLEYEKRIELREEIKRLITEELNRRGIMSAFNKLKK